MKLPKPEGLVTHIPTGYVVRGYTEVQMREYAESALAPLRTQLQEVRKENKHLRYALERVSVMTEELSIAKYAFAALKEQAND